MFKVTIGPHTTEVECQFIEVMANSVFRTERTVNNILELLNIAQEPQIKFIIGPVSEQKSETE